MSQKTWTLSKPTDKKTQHFIFHKWTTLLEGGWIHEKE